MTTLNSTKEEKCVVEVLNREIESIELEKDNVELEVGNKVKVNATITPEELSSSINWKSDYPSIATVDNNGLITAISPGDTIIRAIVDSKEATLTTIYKEITAGKPVVLQVNGNKSGTSRHFVTVVGFKEGVNSASELKEEDLLIYDSWDGKVERMDTSSSRFMTTGKQTGKTYSGYYLRILK